MNIFSAKDCVLEPVGERCMLIRVGEHLDDEIIAWVHAVTARVAAAALPGVEEVVPAFTTVAVQYRPEVFDGARGLPSLQLMTLLRELLSEELMVMQTAARQIEIPACYGGEFGPDLDEVAQFAGISAEEVVALHSGREMTVYAFFFSPGNSFSGPVDDRLGIGRRATPRTRVEAGSVAIANGLTSIYQNASPGGWQVIARTPWNMFDLANDPPVRLRLGDRIRFRPVSAEEFVTLLEPRP
ncbi:5-oxoprolinase subunit PxpB [Brenneria populi]|uniref:5-oxoprolinase subunit PxpB n=1 Tax=Brenneria populi TaxID=1505588 RepID=A0ABU6JQC3_9GAMM|nr:5-oxoprolinase subunit PxpB [Brenneria populi Li et al. 2015]